LVRSPAASYHRHTVPRTREMRPQDRPDRAST
jgi:hypothetical protein